MKKKFNWKKHSTCSMKGLDILNLRKATRNTDNEMCGLEHTVLSKEEADAIKDQIRSTN